MTRRKFLAMFGLTAASAAVIPSATLDALWLTTAGRPYSLIGPEPSSDTLYLLPRQGLPYVDLSEFNAVFKELYSDKIQDLVYRHNPLARKLALYG